MKWAALGVLVAAVGLLAIDGTVLYLAVPSLTRELGATADQVLWIGDIYSLTLAGLLITMGSLGDRIGRKRLLLIGTTGFGAASLLAAFAPTAEWLIAARLLLGVAGATIMPSTLSIIRNLFTEANERRRAIAIWSAASAGGLALGPLVGGALLEHFWWGSVFLINVPVTVVLLIFGLRWLPESRNPAPGPFDPLSSLLSMITIVPLVHAVKHTVGAGPDLVGLGAVVIGLTAGLWFVRRQRRLTTPMIDVTLFANPAFSGAVLATMIAIFALTGLLFFFSQYLQLVRGFSPLVAGVAELPTTLASIAVVGLITVLVRRLGAARTIVLGLSTASVGLALVAVAESADHYLWLALALVPVGAGIGLAMTLTTDAVVSAVPRTKAGAASAVAETAFELGVALGIALLGSVVTLVYRGVLVLPPGMAPADARALQESLATGLNAVGGDAVAATAAREAFTTAMQTTSVVAAVITALAALVAWRTLGRVTPHRAHDHDHHDGRGHDQVVAPASAPSDGTGPAAPEARAARTGAVGSPTA